MIMSTVLQVERHQEFSRPRVSTLKYIVAKYLSVSQKTTFLDKSYCLFSVVCLIIDPLLLLTVLLLFRASNQILKFARILGY